MKKFFMCILLAVMVGCTASPSTSDSERNFTDAYPDVPEENIFYYAEDESAVLAMLEHGTGIVYLGFDSCPFCQAYSVLLNEAVYPYEVPVMYYDILKDRENNTEFYRELVSILGDHLEYDNDGNHRIYVPDVTFIVQGEIIEHNNESSLLSSEEISPEEYWTEERRSSLLTQLSSAADLVAKARKENEEKGCDTGCKVD